MDVKQAKKAGESCPVSRSTRKQAKLRLPYDIHLKHKKYYQSIFYLIFKLIGLRIDAEVHTNQGRIDAVIVTAARIFLFEFKLDKSAAEALEQIRTHDYFRKYQGHGKPMTLIGANFDSAQRKVSEWLSGESLPPFIH